MRHFAGTCLALAGTDSHVWIRTAAARDVESLTEYFGTLSHPSRYNRFMGAVSNFSRIAVDCLVHGWKPGRFTLVAEIRQPAGDVIVGEASYAFDPASQCGEFAISVLDGWQRQGLGSALLCALQSRAISLGHYQLFGETLKTNNQMKCLARQAGFAMTGSPDWRAIRFDKNLAA